MTYTLDLTGKSIKQLKRILESWQKQLGRTCANDALVQKEINNIKAAIAAKTATTKKGKQ